MAEAENDKARFPPRDRPCVAAVGSQRLRGSRHLVDYQRIPPLPIDSPAILYVRFQTVWLASSGLTTWTGGCQLSLMGAALLAFRCTAGGSPTSSFIDLAPTYNFKANLPSPVPEPGTWLLVATGLGAVIRRAGKNLRA